MFSKANHTLNTANFKLNMVYHMLNNAKCALKK
jgi:hypothetical protein